MDDIGDMIRQRQDQMPPHLRGMDHNAPDALTKQVTAQLAAQTGVELFPGDIWVRVCDGTEVAWNGDPNNPYTVAFAKGHIAFGYISRQGERAMQRYMARSRPHGSGLPAGLEVIKRAPDIDPAAVAKAQQIRQVLMDRLDSLKKRYDGHHVESGKLADMVRNACQAAFMEEGMDDAVIDVQVHSGRVKVKIQGTIAGLDFVTQFR